MSDNDNLPIRVTVTLESRLDPKLVQAALVTIGHVFGVQSAEVQCWHGEGDVCEDCDGFGL